MRFDDDMTLKEIAAKLDMNINTVYKYLVQSIQRVRNEVGPKKS
jgi:DNA-binding CsgD family transcriptional regulator